MEQEELINFRSSFVLDRGVIVSGPWQVYSHPGLYLEPEFKDKFAVVSDEEEVIPPDFDMSTPIPDDMGDNVQTYIFNLRGGTLEFHPTLEGTDEEETVTTTSSFAVYWGENEMKLSLNLSKTYSNIVESFDQMIPTREGHIFVKWIEEENEHVSIYTAVWKSIAEEDARRPEGNVVNITSSEDCFNYNEGNDVVLGKGVNVLDIENNPPTVYWNGSEPDLNLSISIDEVVSPDRIRFTIHFGEAADYLQILSDSQGRVLDFEFVRLL